MCGSFFVVVKVKYIVNFSFLSTRISNGLLNLNYNKLNEIRIRSGQPVIVLYDGEYKYLGDNGAIVNKNNAITVTDAQKILNEIISGNLFVFSEQLKNGFITVENGIRIGIAGEYITEGNKINTITNVTSLNIRIPHEIIGCSNYLFETVFKDRVNNVLIFSKPALGKTTMLRDVVRKLAVLGKSVLLFDERNEISGIKDNKTAFNVGESVDVIRGANKLYAIKNAIRVMNPKIIVTDELCGDDDIKGIIYAIECGINVIASSHYCDINRLKLLPFNYFVNLVGFNKKPIIYDKNFNIVCGDNINDVARSFGGKR